GGAAMEGEGGGGDGGGEGVCRPGRGGGLNPGSGKSGDRWQYAALGKMVSRSALTEAEMKKITRHDLAPPRQGRWADRTSPHRCRFDPQRWNRTNPINENPARRSTWRGLGNPPASVSGALWLVAFSSPARHGPS